MFYVSIRIFYVKNVLRKMENNEENLKIVSLPKHFLRLKNFLIKNVLMLFAWSGKQAGDVHLPQCDRHGALSQKTELN